MFIKLKKLSKSLKKDKKYTAVFEIKKNSNVKDGKTQTRHFGYNNPDDKNNDYTKHEDISRRNRYIIRHEKDLSTGDPSRAGFLSMFILWNKPNIEEAVKDYNRRLNIYNKTGKFPYKDLIEEAEKQKKEEKEKKEDEDKKEDKNENKM
jgi:hypothetical protein